MITSSTNLAAALCCRRILSLCLGLSWRCPWGLWFGSASSSPLCLGFSSIHEWPGSRLRGWSLLLPFRFLWRCHWQVLPEGFLFLHTTERSLCTCWGQSIFKQRWLQYRQLRPLADDGDCTCCEASCGQPASHHNDFPHHLEKQYYQAFPHIFQPSAP